MSWQLMTCLSCLFKHVQTVLTWDVAPFAAICPAYCSILALMYRMLRWSLSLQSLTKCHAFGIQILWLQILQLQLFHIIHVATICCPFLSIFWEWSKLLKMALDFPIIVLTCSNRVPRCVKAAAFFWEASDLRGIHLRDSGNVEGHCTGMHWY